MSVSQEQETSSAASDQTASTAESEKMIDQLTEMNQSINSLVNDSLGVKNIGGLVEDFGNYLQNGFQISMSGETQTSLLQSFTNQDDTKQAMDKHDKSANKANQSMDMVQNVVEVVEENPELLAAL